MALPDNVDTCTVTGSFVYADGSIPEGTVEFTPTPCQLLDASSAPPATIVQAPIVAVVGPTGEFAQQIPATDDPDLNPVDWTYCVRVRLNGTGPGVAYSFNMAAPTGTVDLADVTPVGTSNGTAIVVGPPGPPGADGPAGEGVPAGGAAGEVLAKLSGTDYDSDWIPASAPGVHASTHAAGSTDPVTLTQAQVTGLTSDLAAKASTAALTAHESDTTAVHGIADTSQLATTTDLTTHAADTTNVHGITDTSALATTTALALKADKSTTITPTAPLAGGGDLSANRTLTVATFGTAASGVVPPSGGGTANYLRADGTWSTPAGGGGGISTEDAVDAVAAALVEGTGIDIVYDDGANTITVTADKTEMSLSKSDVGLGNVDNTTDANKPVSTATTTALGLKADKTTTIATTAPLAGGGDLSTGRTLTVAAFSTTTTAAGVVPGSNNAGTGSFLRADGTWALAPGAGGTVGHASYTHNSTLTEPPATGQIRFNNASQLAATKVWVSQNDEDGLDVSIGLAKVLVGHQIYIQDYDNAANWIKYNVTAVSDDGAYYDFTVTYNAGPGGIPSGSGAAGRVEFQPVAPGTVGVPSGGTTGQVLAKTSSADYAVAWSADSVADDAVTNAKLANVATNTIKGRTTASTGDPEDLTPAQARTVIASDSGGGTANYLRADGTWAAPPGGGGGINGITVAEAGSSLDTDITTLDFLAGFDLTETPENEVNIALDLTEYTGGALPVAGGGTGATSAGAALTALGAQPSDTELTAIAGLTSAADQVPYFTGSGTASLMTVTSAARGVLDDTSTANMLTSLGGVPTTRTISTTAPLQGGNDLSANRTLTVDAATLTAAGVVELATTAEATAQTDAVRAVTPAGLADRVLTSRTITTTAPLSGGGALTGNLTLTVGAASETATGVVELATAAEVLTGTDTTRAVTAAGATGAFAPKLVTINAQTGTTYTLVLADASKLVTLSNAGAITLTVPTNASVAYPTGTRIDLAQLGAGQVTVAGSGGVTVNATPTLKFRAQYAAATLVKYATDTWLLVGDLSTT